MKQFYFFILQITFCITTIAQVDNYDISKYARQDLIRKTADFTTQASLSNTNNTIYNTSQATSRFRFSARGNVDQTKFVNSLNTQSFSALSYGLSTSFASYADTPTNSVNSDFELDPRLRYSIAKKNFKEDQKFLETNFDIDLSYASTHSNIQNTENTHFGRLSSFNDLQVGIGKGRQELVLDAWNACTIFEFLKDKSLLLRKPDHETITAFANTLAEAKNARFTDPRHESINEYELIVNFLIEQKLIDPSDYRVFAIVNDAYRFERFIQRLHGTSVSVGVTSFIDIDKTSGSGGFSNPWFTTTSAGLYFNYDSDKVISQDFQQNFGFYVDLGTRWVLNDLDSQDQAWSSVVQAQYSYGYYPSQRTNLELGLTAFYRHIFDTNDFSNGQLRLTADYN